MTDPLASAPAAPALDLKGLTKSYRNGPTALDHISLTVDQGCFCVVLGSSGSGKSTLLKCITGLVTPCSGEIRVNGTPMTRKTLRTIGMVHQDFGLTERLTSAQNVMAGAASITPSWRIMLQAYPLPVQRKACQLLARVGLTEAHANRRVKALSGGQKQRVGIARALITDPSLILADEPVASLDPRTSAEIMQLLKDAARERNAAVLCSLHQIDLARAFADRIIGLQGGHIIFDGPPEELDHAALSTIFKADETGPRLKFAVA
ncbi:MAG: phosphonate ABC transporter ATP-binding protein [Alphaproteobacteria bacterium]|nr:phosphonate ABC transporter [Hyphomonas sp.]MBR9807287.1 phosphonate ABC transporter ATP-binding protein [Alphaproteobacteria bacterium]|tara:strand:- start:1074 stop:1862 length:789 start_codon:yes stop_codon:yes gene_type:complete